MPSPITLINGGSLPALAQPAALSKPGGPAFKDVLQDAVQRVDAFQKDAAKSVDRFLSGESDDVHSTILAAQRAELSLELFLQVRNKVVNAYQEVMRMQL
ncbi:MAG TPA: flagellar hook-basal body complex protein FliE [Solibacterales bacterium]|nr:flagellar hook-basal body complex protein FliE [Bryobacterales bacterium]